MTYHSFSSVCTSQQGQPWETGEKKKLMTGDARGSHQLRVAMPNLVIKWAKRNTHSDPGLLGLVQLLHPVPKVNVTEALPC